MRELAAAVSRPSPTPSRRAVVEELGHGDRPAVALTRKLRISQPALPRHLRLHAADAGGRHRYRLAAASTSRPRRRT